MMTAKMRLPIDLFMFAAFVAAYRPFATGLALHEWLSLALVTPVLVHAVVNWDWAARMVRSFGRQLRAKNRVNLVVDVALFVSTVSVMLSGFMVSRVIAGLVGLSATTDPAWYSVHSFSADAALSLALLHTVLHWKWFARMLKIRPASRARSSVRGLRAAEAYWHEAEGSWWSAVPEKMRDDYRRSQLVPAPIPVRSNRRPR